MFDYYVIPKTFCYKITIIIWSRHFKPEFQVYENHMVNLPITVYFVTKHNIVHIIDRSVYYDNIESKITENCAICQ